MSERETIELALRLALEAEGSLAWAYLFGSAARSEGFRDVDVAVMPAKAGFTRLAELGRLHAHLTRAVGRGVDLVDLSRAPLVLVRSVLSCRRLLLDRDRARRHLWEAETLSRSLDFEPVRQRYLALREERLRQRLAAGG